MSATLALALYLLAPGYLLGALTDVAGFRSRGWKERLLWSISFSFPVATMLAVLGGQLLSPALMNGLFVCLALTALGSVFHSWSRGRERKQSKANALPRTLLGAVALSLASLLYLLFTTPLLFRGHLEENVVSNDWYIRLPLQYSARMSGVPPVNSLFTLHGSNPPLHYYYFFWTLCAEPMRLFGLSARSVVAASTVWSAILFASVLLLALKYLVLPAVPPAAGPAENPSRTARSLAPMLLAVSLIAGLDILPLGFFLLLHVRPFPTLFWWSREGVSTWLGSLPFVPHHYAGMAYALLGYMLLVCTPQTAPASGSARQRRHAATRSCVVVAALAGLCFSAVLGTSTFIAMGIFLAAGALLIDAALQRRWALVWTIAGSLLFALLLDIPYLLQTVRHAGGDGAAAVQSAGRPFTLYLRNWRSATVAVRQIIDRLLHRPAPANGRVRLLAAVMLPFLYALDLGFFWFVLWYRFKADRAAHRRGAPLTRASRGLWILFCSYAFLCCFISSAPLQHGINDLGRHTALALRVVLILWAAPMASDALRYWRSRASLPKRTQLALAAAACCAVLGWVGTAWEVGMERLYLPLVDFGVIRGREIFTYPPGVGLRYAALQQAGVRIAAATPTDAIVQANPDGILQRPVLLYLDRRVAAGDVSCETGFGGSQRACIQENVRPLLALYAQPERDWYLQVPPAYSPQQFDLVCADLDLTALLVTDYDPVWHDPASWVWHEPALFSGEYVKVLRCPVIPRHPPEAPL